MRKVLGILGPVCSGKTTYMERYPADRWLKIDIGSIVREITQTQERVFDKTLDEQIIRQLRMKILTSKKDVIVSGIRQVSIGVHLEIIAALDEFMWIYLDVPQEVLEARYEKRAAEKDLKLTFQQAIGKEVELGYNDMIRHFNESKYKCTIKNYNEDEHVHPVQKIEE